VGQGDAPFRHHLDQVTGTQFEAHVPSHAQDDDLVIEVPSLEEILCRARFDHAGPYRRKPSFSGLHQNRWSYRGMEWKMP
jgi:hypothetical protein